MRKVNLLLRGVEGVNVWLGRFLSLWILIMTAIIVWEVVLRYAFNAPTIWVHEMSQMLFAGYVILGAGYTLTRQTTSGHIRMDILYRRLPPRRKAIIDLASSITFFLFVGIVLWQGWGIAMRSLQLWEHSTSTWGPPIYPIKFCIPVGVSLILVQGVVTFIRDLITVTTGRQVA